MTEHAIACMSELFEQDIVKSNANREVRGGEVHLLRVDAGAA